MKNNNVFFSAIAVVALICTFTTNAQVGIGTTTPRGTLEVVESNSSIESPTVVISSSNGRTLNILSPDIADNDDPFTFATNNAYQFRVDARDAFVINANGNVGVNTSYAQSAFHLAGSNSKMRLDYLNSTNSEFNNGTDPAVVKVDASGQLFIEGAVDDFPVNVSETEGFFATPIALQSTTGETVAANAYSTTLTLTKTTLVEVSFWTTVNIRDANGAIAQDDKPRLYGGLVSHTDSGGVLTDIVYSASSYTNALNNGGSTGDVIAGFFTIGGNGFITLDAGTHTLSLDIFAGGGEAIVVPPSAATGVLATFGSTNLSRFQVIYHN